MDVGVICACMPAMYSLFKHYFPQAFDGTSFGKSRTSGASGSRSGTGIPGTQASWRRDKKDDVEDTVRLVDLRKLRHDHITPGTAF